MFVHLGSLLCDLDFCKSFERYKIEKTYKMYNNLICLPSGLSENHKKKICFFSTNRADFNYIYAIFDFFNEKKFL